MKAVVQIDGGVGRALCSIPALERMATKGRDVIIITGHPEVFQGNPHFYKIYGLNREYIFDDVIQHNEFFYPEPYWSTPFYQRREHLITTFYRLLNPDDTLPPLSSLRPTVYITREEQEEAQNYIKGLRGQIGKRRIIAFQPFGATYNATTDCDTTNRSLGAKVVERVLTELEDVGCFLNFTLYSLSHRSMCYDTFPLRKLFALTPLCDYIITVDSFLSHLGWGLGKGGMQFLGGTDVANFGYEGHYKTFSREGYPRSYLAFRMTGCLEKNQGAMDLTNEELGSVIETIRRELSEASPCLK